MSDYRAIGGVSKSLKSLLLDRMILSEDMGTSSVSVTLGPPALQPATDQTLEPPRLNLFLYQISENPYLKNQNIPGRGDCSRNLGHPPLSLDLSYMLTAYGSQSEGLWVNQSLAHYLLGSAMRVFHDYSVITEDLRLVREAKNRQVLDKSLIGEYEMIKITLYPMGIEDSMKIWTALMAPYRPSVFYHVNVIQIESRHIRRYPRLVGELPTKGPRVQVVSFQPLRIASLSVIRANDDNRIETQSPYCRIGDYLVLKGQGLGGNTTKVVLDGNELNPTRLRDDMIEVIVPGDIGLQPGPVSVNVSAKVMMGEPLRPHVASHSNQVVFMLVPKIGYVNLDRTTVPRTLSIQGNLLSSDTLPWQAIVGTSNVSTDDFITITPDELSFYLPDTLPAYPLRCLISGPLPIDFPQLELDSTMDVTIGPDGPHQITIDSSPKSILEASSVLQNAIRRANDGGVLFKRALVGTMNDRLILIPGGLGDVSLTFESNDTSQALKLVILEGEEPPETLVDTAYSRNGYLSGDLSEFSGTSIDEPWLRVSIGSITRDVHLTSRPTTVERAVQMLETAIRGSDPSPGFSNCNMTTIGNRMLFIPGTDEPVSFMPVPVHDDTSVSELQFNASYRVRVRVNGAESIDDIDIALP